MANKHYSDIAYQMLIEIKRDKYDAHQSDVLDWGAIRSRKRYNAKCRVFAALSRYAANLIEDTNET